MYIPKKFKEEDPKVIQSFIRKNSFGLLLSTSNGEIYDTHTPFLVLEDGTLLGHIAKSNPQWKTWKNKERVKVIFTGPHSYISPSYYQSEFNVPTWNYTAVPITGELNIIEDVEEVAKFLDVLVSIHEASSSSSWQLDTSDQQYMNLLSAIVVFSVSPEKIDASFKLNQNKSEADQSSVVHSLNRTGCPFDKDVASLMESKIKKQNE